jgi:cation:H+ antiporter
MFVKLLLLILGFALLLKGADWLVSGASSLAKRFRISELAIGLTIVAFGTSAPELVVSVMGALDGHNEVVMGNVIGSNNFNLFIILGFAGLMQPLWVQHSTVWREIPYSLLAVVLLWLLANDSLLWNGPSQIGRLDSLLLLLLFVLFLSYVYRSLRREKAFPEAESSTKSFSTKKSSILILVGLAGLVLGGRLVIDQALAIAYYLQVDERIIGLTVVAAGTSLPELATSVVAALRKRADLAVGNIIGSNIFNIFFVLGTSALIRPVGFNSAFNLELYILMAGTVFVFVAMFTGGRQRLDRWEAFFLLAIYLLYSYYFYTDQSATAVQTL